MAKGGTGAIPGAFGTGKCLLPGTPVLLADGRLVPIERLFMRVKGGDPDLSRDEEIYRVFSKEILVYSFNGRDFIKMPVSHVYRGRTNKIVKIKTRNGRVIKVTPIHRLIIYDLEKGFVEVPAISVRRGDLLVVPRKISIESRARIDLYKYMPEAVAKSKKVKSFLLKLVKKIAEENNISISKMASLIDLDSSTLNDMIRGRRSPSLQVIERICRLAGLKPPHPFRIAYYNGHQSIIVPKYVEDEFAYFLGLVSGGGFVRRNSKGTFLNIVIPKDGIDPWSIIDLVERVFKPRPRDSIKISGKIERNMLGRKSLTVSISIRILADLMERLRIVSENPAKKRIPSLILRASERAVEYFLAGYFRVLGYYSGNKIYLATLSKSSRDRLAYLLTRLGISYRLGEIERSNDQSSKLYLVIIDRPYDIILFSERVLSRDILSNKSKFAPFNTYTMPVRSEIENLKREILSRAPLEYLVIPEEIVLRRISTTSARADGSILLLQRQIVERTTGGLEDLARVFRVVDVDPVIDVEVLEGEWVVYDLTVPGTHNFVGGSVPSLFHNTVTLHSLAMWSDARVVIYIGCGERGNEMTEVLERFPETKDPWTGRPLMERTILIANTSNMPVSAREASIYVGVTIGEYYRDLGYDVLLVADSTSRWAEALREISGRLEEMPAEEGYPSYLQSRLAEFYERAGRVVTLGRPERRGSVTIIGAVSPPGGDFTEPVTTHTRRFIRVFWALDASLAYSRHYPAINWITSYSAYVDLVGEWWAREVDPSWRNLRDEIVNILLRENELREVIRLIGSENLPEPDKLVVEVARMIKDGFLRQNAYDPVDAFSTPKKQFKLMKLLVTFYRNAKPLVDSGIPVRVIKEKTQSIITDIVKARFTVENDRLEKLDELENRLLKVFEELKGEKK
ncbi:MAG: V-type ATP synthase subunit A [Sulfolobales archaeon]